MLSVNPSLITTTTTTSTNINRRQVYDGYPKARVHLLLLPKPAFLAVNAVTDLRREHLERLRGLWGFCFSFTFRRKWEGLISCLVPASLIPSTRPPGHTTTHSRLAVLHAEARRIRDKLQGDLAGSGRAPSSQLRLGYHALPSLHPLHCHLISQDFDAPALKTKKHWNSFTTAFFLDADAVEAALREEGRVAVEKPRAEALLKEPLRCHACGAAQANMPAVKSHLSRCQQVKDGRV